MADHFFSANLKEETEFCPFDEDNDDVDDNEDDGHHHPASRGGLLINVGISYHHH